MHDPHVRHPVPRPCRAVRATSAGAGLLLVGINEALKIILIAKAAAVPIALNTCKGLQGVPTQYIEPAAGRVLRRARRHDLEEAVCLGDKVVVMEPRLRRTAQRAFDGEKCL